MKHKIFTFFLAVVAGVGTMYASDIQVDGIWYDFDSSTKTACVTFRGSYSSTFSNEYTGNIIIPSNVTYDGQMYSVTAIGMEAFRDCSTLTSITIPESVTEVGTNAFEGCSNLPIIDNIRYADTYLVGAVGAGPYVIQDGTRWIGDEAFYGCSLVSITIPNSVEEIGEEAFYTCRKLNEIIIGTGLKKINRNAFGYCPIERLYILDIAAWCNVQFSGSWSHPFSYGSLYDYSTHIYLNNVEIIDLHIPEGVTQINGSFQGCSNIETVSLPNSLVTIGEDAFDNCVKIQEVNFPKGVKYVGSFAFNKTAVTNIILPESIEKIDKWAFYGCTNLVSVIIPSGIVSIGYNAFGQDKNLQYVVLLAPNPPVIDKGESYSIFQTTTSRLYVPTLALSLYTNDNIWKQISDKIKPLASFPYKIEKSATSCAIYFGYEEESRYVDNCGICDGMLFVGNIVEYNGLVPNSIYADIPFFVNTTIGYSDTINISFTTTELSLNTIQPKVVSNSTAILLAETNMADAEVNCGFEWKRNDAPEDFEATKVFCPVANGVMAGRLKGLKDDVYYKYRAFYQSAASNMYYGDWKYIFTGDDAVEFDPVLYTYEATAVTETEATLKGYALEGSDDFIEQGFEYWADSRVSPDKASAARRTAIGDKHTVAATGIAMKVTLTDLDEGTVYKYRTYAKSESTTVYGSEMSFTTKGQYNDPMTVESVQTSDVSAQKMIRDGQLYIMYEGQMYDVRGARVE